MKKSERRRRNKEQKHFYVYYIQPLHIVWITDVRRTHASRALGIGNNNENQRMFSAMEIARRMERLINSDWTVPSTQFTRDKALKYHKKRTRVISMQNLSLQSLARSASTGCCLLMCNLCVRLWTKRPESITLCRFAVDLADGIDSCTRNEEKICFIFSKMRIVQMCTYIKRFAWLHHPTPLSWKCPLDDTWTTTTTTMTVMRKKRNQEVEL